MKLTVLLTGSIQPNASGKLAITNPTERRQQYFESFRKWLTARGPHDGVVFIENSGADLGEFVAQSKATSYRKSEVISLNLNQFPSHLGKGYGEFMMVDQAMHCSRLIQDSEKICKVTGRLFVQNFAAIANRLPNHYQLAGDVFLPDAKGSRLFLDSRLMFFSPSFYDRWFHGLYRQMDDSTRIYAEIVLARVLCKQQATSFIPVLPLEPVWCGLSGTHGIDYNAFREKIRRPFRNIRRLYRRISGFPAYYRYMDQVRLAASTGQEPVSDHIG